jgi:Tfp pilus assembly protein PilE
LLLGQPDKALQELTLLNNLRHLLEAAPTGKPMTLVSAMINVAVVGLYADVIADGFRLHAWQEPQLIALQKQLGQINLAPFLKESFHDEQVGVCRTFQTAMSRFQIQPVPNATLWQKIKYAESSTFMRGFFYFNVVNTVKPEQEVVDSIDLTQKIVLPQKLAELQREEDALGRRHFAFYHLLAMIAVPNGTKAVQTFAFNQTKTDEAQIVCALERYRLVHGNYPETLNELVPQFTDKLPPDIIDGQSLKYCRTPDGQFLLYCVGWNGTDDGGKFDSSYENGDWVWQ